MASILRFHDRVSEQAERLKERTMRFALDVCKLIRLLPYWEPGPTVSRQIAKSSTSVAFNYRASCRSRSHAEFTAKIGTVAEESDETLGWLEFIAAGRLIEESADLPRLVAEAGELLAIFSASVGTARYRNRNRTT
jgi:four helix bundle protein